MPPIILLPDMVARCRLIAAHGLTSCLSVRTQPLTATGAPSQTSTIPYHTILIQPSIRSLVDSVSCLRYAEFPVPPIILLTDMVARCRLRTSCTWPYVVPIGEDPAAHGHWCAFTDLYHTIPYHGCATVDATSGYAWLPYPYSTIPYHQRHASAARYLS